MGKSVQRIGSIMEVDLSKYRELKPKRWKRIIWLIVSNTIYRCFPTVYLRRIRNLMLRAFGCRLPLDVLVYPSCKIYAPWLLEIGSHACIGPKTEIYNKARVTIGNDTVLSQGSFLCTASHDISSLMLPLTTAPITLGDNVWVAANAFVGPGVTIGSGAVVGATASVYKSVDPYMVVGGNPARPIHPRIIKSEQR